MARAIKIRVVDRVNNFPKLKRKVGAAMNPRTNIATQTARFSARKIKTIQRKAPKKPRHFKTDTNKTMYGFRASYKPGTKKFKQGKRAYQRKGLYSKPGSPPFWHEKSDNAFKTMRIVGEFDKKGYTKVFQNLFPGGPRGGRVRTQKIVGPAVRQRRGGRMSVPELHEFGGTVKLGRSNSMSYRARNGAKIIRRQQGVANYPKRPFVRPGARQGSLEAWNKYHRSKLTNIAGMRASKVIKFRRAA